MEYSKAKSGQLVLVTHHAEKGKSKGKLIHVFVGEIKSKIKGSRTQIRVKDFHKGLGYNAATRSYEGCQVQGGWFRGKPHIVTPGPEDLDEEYDVYHCKELSLFNAIMTQSKKLHQLAPGTSPHRVHTFRGVGQKIKSSCHVELVSINTQEEAYNGTLIRLHSTDRKQSSDWIWFSCFISPKNVEGYMIEFKKKFLTPVAPKKKK